MGDNLEESQKMQDNQINPEITQDSLAQKIAQIKQSLGLSTSSKINSNSIQKQQIEEIKFGNNNIQQQFSQNKSKNLQNQQQNLFDNNFYDKNENSGQKLVLENFLTESPNNMQEENQKQNLNIEQRFSYNFTNQNEQNQPDLAYQNLIQRQKDLMQKNQEALQNLEQDEKYFSNSEQNQKLKFQLEQQFLQGQQSSNQITNRNLLHDFQRSYQGERVESSQKNQFYTEIDPDDQQMQKQVDDLIKEQEKYKYQIKDLKNKLIKSQQSQEIVNKEIELLRKYRSSAQNYESQLQDLQKEVFELRQEKLDNQSIEKLQNENKQLNSQIDQLKNQSIFVRENNNKNLELKQQNQQEKNTRFGISDKELEIYENFLSFSVIREKNQWESLCLYWKEKFLALQGNFQQEISILKIQNAQLKEQLLLENSNFQKKCEEMINNFCCIFDNKRISRNKSFGKNRSFNKVISNQQSKIRDSLEIQQEKSFNFDNFKRESYSLNKNQYQISSKSPFQKKSRSFLDSLSDNKLSFQESYLQRYSEKNQQNQIQSQQLLKQNLNLNQLLQESQNSLKNKKSESHQNIKVIGNLQLSQNKFK
ncbi:hypothetical protein PPERSA_10925 [Pseudocohnilembus persalinus]|uniref:Uncharacterized protein n=1 Tax=Pseudocohnilembus persalinus TaxID=266149 RepID=A0A0V0R9I4_PSEPJ|nr:hypothetical protein PPERSA_10925 [Pseudocohnilembus persalinus]|eukprot:KRX11158.1 hypothetical protein PPERSA_10925 [Pseudocohnilembus persalinus]